MNINLWPNLLIFVCFLFFVVIAFLPTIIAVTRKHPQTLPIVLVNILGGLFFGLGWLVALVWCFIVPQSAPKPTVSIATEIEKLHELLEKGILTQSEYDAKKRELLNA